MNQIDKCMLRIKLIPVLFLCTISIFQFGLFAGNDDTNSVTGALSGTLEPVTSFWGVGEHNERVGYYVSGAGDVNGDGFDDFMAANYHHDTYGWNCGGVYLFLGAQDKTWGREEPMSVCDALFKGSREDEMVGYNVDGKGDFNGDGYDDLLIGAPGTWETEEPNFGLTYIVLGKANPDWGKDFLLATQTDISYIGEAYLDQLGYAVSYIGDINNDGCDDILTSAAFKTLSKNEWAGKVYLIMGKKEGFARDIPVMNEAVASFIFPEYKGTLGFAVEGVGDVNNDGLLDFAMSAQGIGKTFIMFGRPEQDWGHDFNLENADVTITPERDRAGAGWQIKEVGDVNDDGINDFSITGVECHYNFGKVYLLFGREEWPKEISLFDADASWIGENKRADGGMSINTVEDFDGDGIDDFIFGSRYFSDHWPHAGKVYLVKGCRTGWERDLSMGVIPDYYTPDDSIKCAGWGCAGIGDYNGDGCPDFITSAPFSSNHDLEWNGEIHLFYGHYDLNSLSGKITYPNSDETVPRVRLTLSGDQEKQNLSDEAGNYEFKIRPKANVRVTPTKDAGEDVTDGCISAYDAALVARHFLDIESLTNSAQMAADVDQDQKITLFDAALIARESVGLPLIEGSHAANWIFSPASKEYSDFDKDQSSQNFEAMVIGDVDLDWEQEVLSKSTKELANLPELINIDENNLFLPIQISNENKVLSLDAQISYNPAFFEFVEIEKQADWNEMVNDQSGQLNIALYRAQITDKPSEVINIKFRAINQNITSSEIELNRLRLNNYQAMSTNIPIQGSVNKALPEQFKINQNFPNPFQNRTSIQFELPHEEFVTVRVYNLLGQEIIRLADQKLNSGTHNVHWDGKDFLGQNMPAGIYYYELVAGTFRQVKKLVLLP